MFRTTEISDAAFESANLRFITVKTEKLRGRGDICVFVPPMADLEDLPLVILLHGVYGSAWVWSQKAGVHISALQMMEKGEIPPMVIAMPSDGLWGDGSGYLPHHQKDFESWIVDDVPNAVIENVPSVSKKSELFISGLSMGGFGALRLGVKYHDRFKAISAHSSITDIAQMELFVEEPLDSYVQEDLSENTVWGLIEKNKAWLPNLRFDCGTEDDLIPYNRTLHKNLEANRIPHLYEEFKGAHEWTYWSEHVKDSLRFFSRFC
ncbi:S-formylglutathione hydrolase FrmB [Zobellia uliginosa]|uniref:S-formylglutathione hydrolase FrmB n=1 Tax=Zobellia uliginosa TaxID=143224 RepID=A0ABY1KRJ0_9FLAO|nr:alpha/beta hydrolase-fold protein [Zobellia uliginosa]SIS67407.1 S-formylglutathione hydrolase FrmB [Zobellia uliginosa]